MRLVTAPLWWAVGRLAGWLGTSSTSLRCSSRQLEVPGLSSRLAGEGSEARIFCLQRPSLRAMSSHLLLTREQDKMSAQHRRENTPSRTYSFRLPQSGIIVSQDLK